MAGRRTELERLRKAYEEQRIAMDLQTAAIDALKETVAHMEETNELRKETVNLMRTNNRLLFEHLQVAENENRSTCLALLDQQARFSRQLDGISTLLFLSFILYFVNRLRGA